MGGGRRRPGAGGSLPPDCPGRDEALAEGEGALAYAGEFYVEPLEVQIEFLKAANGEAWLKALLLRHVQRVRQVSGDLFVAAEIKEVVV